MIFEKVAEFLKDENLELETNYLNFISSEYINQISKTVNFDNHDWVINSIERPITKEEIRSDEYDSVEACLLTYGLTTKHSILISRLYHEENELIDKWAVFKEFHPLFNKGLLIIGELDSPHSSILLLGISKANYGQIWMEVGNSLSLIRLADDINDFISKFKFNIYDILVESFKLEFEQSSEGYYKIKTMPNNA
jgi:hypothetical protein